ncbi:oxidoreductase [Methylobacillus flagellatus]|uniref:acrylyl-CoA reductase (NADPH) n=1 Tax=Methylobacillus flagellatus TaxID=405 RepID=UPI0028539210|nr:MDR family oxidoreductase [Methylobacillus flagellatus]MDR5172850.1 oxidoreductase [Methylobacillus flagellatus]
MFKGLLIEKINEEYSVRLTELDDAQLLNGDVTVRVSHSTINYKDALAITGKGSIVRSFPMVPGIDFAGVVEQSNHPDFVPGDNVILNGWGVGESHWGGLAQKARVKGDWLIPLPANISSRDAMALGTAGYTAMLCILAILRHGVRPEDGEIAVTGATGGVGSVAISALSQLGYKVAAITGKSTGTDYLLNLGANEVLDRSSLGPNKPLLKERWVGVIDVLGGNTLANLCASTKYQGIVTACGLAESMELPATVAPFILRGITLVGIDSVRCPKEHRLEAWAKLSEYIDSSKLQAIITEIKVEDAPHYSKLLMDGVFKGRIVVNMDA